MADTPKWLIAIQKHVENSDFGRPSFEVTRHRKTVTKVKANMNSSLKYPDGAGGDEDISRIVSNLSASGYSGKVTFELEYDKGTIKGVIVKNNQEIYERQKPTLR